MNASNKTTVADSASVQTIQTIGQAITCLENETLTAEGTTDLIESRLTGVPQCGPTDASEPDGIINRLRVLHERLTALVARLGQIEETL